MAKVEKIVTPAPAPVPPPVVTYVLTLSAEEVDTLLLIFGAIGGYTRKTRLLSQIGTALEEAGAVRTIPYNHPDIARLREGSIFLRD